MDKAKIIAIAKVAGLVIVAALCVWGGVKVVTSFQHSISVPPAAIPAPAPAAPAVEPAKVVTPAVAPVAAPKK